MKKIIYLCLLLGLLAACGNTTSEDANQDTQANESAQNNEASEAQNDAAEEVDLDPATESIVAKGETESRLGNANFTILKTDDLIFENDDYKVTLEEMGFMDNHGIKDKSYVVYLMIENMTDESVFVYLDEIIADGEAISVRDIADSGKEIEAHDTSDEYFIQAIVSDYDNPPTIDDALEFTLEFKLDPEDEDADLTESFSFTF